VRRIGIVGAGDCGAVLVKELLRSPWLGIRPVAFFDDNYRRRCGIHGLPLVGRPERIEELKDKLRLDEVVIAMPSASRGALMKYSNSLTEPVYPAAQFPP
jgi:Predicted nucleoside-diphosphate sugar epimerases